MLIANIILIVCIYPILPIMYFVLKNEAKPKKNIILGVTLPYDKFYEPKVQELLVSYKRDLGIVALILVPIPFAAFFVGWFSIAFAILMNWTILAIVLPFIPYTRYHRQLKSFKKEDDWQIQTSEKALEAVKSLVPSGKPVNHLMFILPILLSVFPLIYESVTSFGQPEYWWRMLGCGTFTLITVSCIFFNHIIYGQKAEVIDEDININRALTQVRRYYWLKFWLWMVWLTGAFSIIFWLLISGKMSNMIGLILTVSYSIIILCIAVKAEFSTRFEQEQLSRKSTKPLSLDDDACWINGMFYYNPDDKHLIINQRVGMGTTMNLARTTGKVIMIFSLACLLVIPFISIFIMKEEFTPLRTELIDNSIVVTHISKECAIPINDIRSVEIINEMPSSSKIVGTGMDTLKKGTFNVTGYGKCRLYLNPKKPPFLVIHVGDKVYIMNEDESIVDILETRGLVN